MIHVPDAVALGWLGVTLGVASTYVQFQRARSISVDGISLVTWYQFLLMSAFWISYGLAVRSPVVIAGSALVAPMQIAIVARLRPWDHLRTVTRATVFIVACCFVPTVLLGWSAGVLGTGVAMVANRFPQIWTLIRHPGDIGVSATSWAIGAFCSALWILYYSGAHLWAAMAATAAAMCGNIAISALAFWRHRQSGVYELEVATA